MARPAKLSPEITQRVVRLLRFGNSVAVATSASGVSPASYYRWMERGRSEQSGPYADFVAAVDEARAEAEGILVGQVQVGTTADWRASAWRLERMRPEHWARVSERPRRRRSPALDLALAVLMAEK